MTIKYYQEHVDLLDELKVQKDKKYLVKLGYLSWAYFERANYDYKNVEKAIKYGRKGLDLAKSLKVSDEVIAEYELQLGTFYSRNYYEGRKAKRHINTAYDLFLVSYGPQHFKTAHAKFWQAKIDMSYKRNRKASEKLEDVLSVYNETLPAGHDRTLQVHAFLVSIYEKMGKKDKATEHCIAVATERPEGFDREITPLYKITPIYPRSALMAGMNGYIIAEFIVDEVGQVTDLKVIETTNKIFNNAALKALS